MMQHYHLNRVGVGDTSSHPQLIATKEAYDAAMASDDTVIVDFFADCEFEICMDIRRR